jgi:sortase A
MYMSNGMGKTKIFLLTMLTTALILSFGWQMVVRSDISDWIANSLVRSAWLRTQAGGEQIRPWPWAQVWPVANLTAPHFDAEHVILKQEKQLKSGLGLSYLESSVLPGEIGNTVLSAHPNLYFSFLRKLNLNDILVLESPHTGKWHYRVSESFIVDKTYTQLLEHGSKRRLIIISCYQCDENNTNDSLRYVVIAEEDERLLGENGF